MKPTNQIIELTQYITHAQRIFVFTGAGISTNCGIPDFRGPNGVWKTRQPVTLQEFLASESKRKEYWQWKVEGFKAFESAIPSATHLAIVQLERAKKLELLVTQNVDGLHRKAGTSDDRQVEIHGTNSKVQCLSCWTLYPPKEHYAYFAKHKQTPLCACGGFLKPATISFGQNLVSADIQKAQQAARNCDLVIALGSTLGVYPAAEFPLIAAGRGTPYIVINRGITEHDHLNEITLRINNDVDAVFPPAVEKACEKL